MPRVYLQHASKAILKRLSEQLSLVSVLAFVAGLVNSVGFIGFGQFVSHISGHATYAAVQYSQHNYIFAVTSFSAILFFISGSAFTAILLRGKTIDEFKSSYTWPLFIEMLLFCYVVVSWFYYSDIKLKSESFEHAHYYLTLSFAMGMQNATLRRSQSQTLRTTHITGVGTDIGIALGSALIWGAKTIYEKVLLHWRNHDGIWKAPSIVVVSVKAIYFRSKIEKLFLHLSTLIAFATGAAVGTFGFLSQRFLILIVPIAILNFIVFYKLTRLKSGS